MSGTRNADLEIAIKAKADKAIAEFDKFNKSVDENKKAISGIGKAAGVAFAAVTAGLGFSIKEAIKAEEVDRRLETQLKKMGYTSKELAENLKKTATQIANMSNYTDDDLKGAMIRLLAVTKDYNAALKYTQTAADLAARKDITLEQATQALTLAYTGNTGRLKMQGIALEEGVKGLEALEAISKDVAGGAAENIKPITQLTNQIGELGEAIGGPFVEATYKYAKAATAAVNAIISWNDRTGGGLAIAAKYTLALTGLIGAAAFLAPKLKEAAAMAKLFQVALSANPVIAVASAVALLSSVLLDVGEKYVDAYNKEKDFTSSDAGIVKKFQARIDMYKRQGDTLVMVGNQYMKASDAVKVYEKAIEGMASRTSGATWSRKAGSGDTSPSVPSTGGPVLEDGLKSSLDNMGIATDQFTTEQIEKYNNMYTSMGEMDDAMIEAKISKLEESYQEQIKMSAMTEDELSRYKIEKAKQAAQEEQAINNNRLSAFSGMFGDLATLMNSGSREMFEVGKAAAIAQALIDTYLSAQAVFTGMAVAIPGPVGVGLGIAGAAAATTAGLMRVSSIQGTEFKSGATSVLGQGNAQGIYDFRAPGNSEQSVVTIGEGESIVPRRFTEAMRTGEASLGGGKTINVSVNVGTVVGVPKDEFVTDLAQRMNELIQSGDIDAGAFSGANT